MRTMKPALALALAFVLVLAVSADAGSRPYVETCLRSSSPLADRCGPGNLEIGVEGTASARKRGPMPVVLTVAGTIGTENGGHPPALRELVVAVERGAAIDVEGLPSCRLRQLEGLDAAAARQACRGAIVGHGTAHVGFASSTDTVETPLILFNGGTSGGVTRLFAQGSIDGTSPAGLVAVAKIQRHGSGLEATWRLPRIREGDGSLLDFRLSVGRSFAAAGQRHSYVSMACPGVGLQVDLAKAVFVNEAHAPGVPAQTTWKGSLSVPCP